MSDRWRRHGVHCTRSNVDPCARLLWECLFVCPPMRPGWLTVAGGRVGVGNQTFVTNGNHPLSTLNLPLPPPTSYPLIQPRHAEALRLLAAMEPRTAPGATLTARERLELGLLPGDGDSRGIDSLHAAAVASLGLPGSHEAVAFGIRCLLALGELCLELECSERLGLIGGHHTVLRLITKGQISGDARPAVQPPRSKKSEPGVEVERASAGESAPTAVGNSSSVANGHPATREEELEGEEDEVQSAAALVAANVVSSGSSFPMRASFPTGEGSSGLGRFPLQYDFVVSNCAVRVTNDVTAASAAAAQVGSAGSTSDSVQAAGERPLDSENFSILVRPVKERQHSQFDVGFVMWPAAVILSRVLCRHPELVRGRRVLEIGAGLGLAGLVAAHLQQKPAKTTQSATHRSACPQGGATSVTLSDFNPLVLRALEANVALNAGEAAVDGVEQPTGAKSGCCSDGSADGFEQQAGSFCTGDAGTPTGQPMVRIRHLDWDKLEHLPGVKGGRSISAAEGNDPAQAPGSALERPCGKGECIDDPESDCDSNLGLLSGGSTGRRHEEGGGGGMKGIERGERFDLIIASDHICQVR